MKLLPTLLIATTLTGAAYAADQVEQSGEWALLQDSNGQAIYSTEVGAPALVLGCNADGKFPQHLVSRAMWRTILNREKIVLAA